jgi:HK97 family phage prohead protease
MTIEYKNFAIEIKAEPDMEGRFEGYASVFGNVDGGGDIVEKGAFSKSLKGRKPKMLWQHDPGQPIGVWDDVAEDEKGLFVKGRLLLDLPKGREAATMLKAGVIDAMSIGYRTINATTDAGKRGTRKLLDVDLYEVSLVTFPMNEKAMVTEVKQIETKTEIEHILREAGVPGAFAKLVALYGFDEAKARVSGQREADEHAESEGNSAFLQSLKALKETFHAS